MQKQKKSRSTGKLPPFLLKIKRQDKELYQKMLSTIKASLDSKSWDIIREKYGLV